MFSDAAGRPRRLVSLTVGLALVVSAAISTDTIDARSSAGAQMLGPFVPPVSGPIIDHFDDSAGPYGPGNRGVDFDTRPGEPVGALGDGVVVFAGLVAGARWVTVLHPGGLRSSYGPLGEILATVGDTVRLGEAIGSAGETLHLGVRRGEAYIDPELLFDAQRWPAHLVPLGGRPAALGIRSGAPPRPDRVDQPRSMSWFDRWWAE